MGGRGGQSHGRVQKNATFGGDPNLPGFLDFLDPYQAYDYHEQHNFSWDVWNRLLSALERQGIYEYTDFYYSKINTTLRERKIPDALTDQQIKGATAGLAKSVVAEDVIVYRGGNAHWTADLLGGTEAQLSDAAFLQSRIGKVVTDLGFMSSGVSRYAAWSADVTYKIYVRKGTKAMYVDLISANRGERELLFNRDTSFKVHSIKTDSKGRIVELVLETVGSKH